MNVFSVKDVGGNDKILSSPFPFHDSTSIEQCELLSLRRGLGKWVRKEREKNERYHTESSFLSLCAVLHSRCAETVGGVGERPSQSTTNHERARLTFFLLHPLALFPSLSPLPPPRAVSTMSAQDKFQYYISQVDKEVSFLIQSLRLASPSLCTLATYWTPR